MPHVSRFVLGFLLLTHVSFGQVDSVTTATTWPTHPRILLLGGEEKAILQTVSTDSTWRKVHQAILTECDSIRKAAPLRRVVIGRRLLDVSREAFRRVFFLAYAWRMTRQPFYLKQAEQELLTVSAFSDWNPSHFLDVAEMTMAVAIGYDWLHADLPESTRATLRTAILTKGLEPSLEAKNNAWLRASHNWNQVCNAGMAYGAMAIYEEQPTLSRMIINRAIKSIVLPMRDYAPDGAYPEGHSYWAYGTGFNVLFISALEKLFQTDFGLIAQPGFLQTASYLTHMAGPSGVPFNYSDAGTNGGLQPAMFWFAQKQKDPSLLWMERAHLLHAKTSLHIKNRQLPAMVIWGAGLPILAINAPKATMWAGQGKNPVALLRSSWTDTAAIFVGLKAGSPAVNHAHMDIGSFVMEANGVRWAMDFGMQNYNSLESKGIDIWGRGQNAQRWRVFRYSNLAHSTLTVNDALQTADGYAAIIRSGETPAFRFATTDMTQLYKGLLTEAKRGLAIVDNAYVVVRDEVKTPPGQTRIRWAMLTDATVKQLANNRLELAKEGKTLLLEVQEPASVTLKTWSTDPPAAYDAPNPGTTLVGFEVNVPTATQLNLTVLLLPQQVEKTPRVKRVKPLRQWSVR